MVRVANILPRAFVFAAGFVGVVNAQANLQVIKPSADNWWVAKSDNVIAWNCDQFTAAGIAQFTILIANTDPKVQTDPQAIVSIENNFDCSLLITSNTFSQGPGTGWQILLADIFNSTHVYATSESFEIKPQGSAYPAQTTPTANATVPANATTGGAAGNGNSTTSTKPSGSMGLKAGMGGLVLGGVMAVAGMML